MLRIDMINFLKNSVSIFCLFVSILTGCKEQSSTASYFEVLDASSTGIDFANNLKSTPEFNMLKYMYFFNGAGVGAGDFNNDGLIDLFFAANQLQNRLYINAGSLQFRDVTKEAGIPGDGGWSTGVSVVDINNDGLLDIYVCRVGNYEKLQSKNLLLVCEKIENGIPVYTDKAKEYGLDFSGFSTQAAFFDYDLDGDLDMYLLNHSLRYNSTFQPRQIFFNTYDSLSGDRLYRNDGNFFTDVTKPSAINSSVIGYGLGIAIADINLDGWPDMYIGNDFHENDYLYINQKNGTFKDVLTEQTMHTSQFSMGVDVADITNDAYPEIISLDMLPDDPYIIRRTLGEDSYDLFHHKVNTGYNYQYARNTLQLNRRNGMFSETGLYSGVYATDWSWGALWMDFDNDGWKDLFVSNGIPRRLNDIDYVNFISNGEMQQKIRENKMEEKDMALVENFPQFRLANCFFKNTGNGKFEELGSEISNNPKTFSNGCAYADLDNDGDLDIVVNNIDEPALIYRNTSGDDKTQGIIRISLTGPDQNKNAIGAKLVLFSGESISTYEKFPVRGFQSSMEVPLQAGYGNKKPDSVLLIWPDNSYQHIDIHDTASMKIVYEPGLPQFDYKKLIRSDFSGLKTLENITSTAGLFFRHEENPFIEFDREQLIPHMISREGPALAVADINADGLEDFFIGSSKRNKSAIFLQQSNGKFRQMIQPALDADSTYEETDACWVDVNNDQYPDLVISSGGNEYYGITEYLTPRVYVNDGKGNLTKLADAFENISITTSCVVPYDFTGDGYVDLFIGGRAVPWNYGKTPPSYLLENDKTGKFRDVTEKYSRELSQAGMVTDAKWVDVNNDNKQDLVITLEWGGIEAYVRDNNVFTKNIITEKKGWWNFILPFDADGDGDMDFIAGNLGENCRLKASAQQPVKMYLSDFDDNGTSETILTYFLKGQEIPFANKAEIEKQLPVLKKKFLYAEDFAKASLSQMLGKDKLKKATVLTADYFSNALLINDGNMNFTLKTLPWEAQLTTYRNALITDANDDGLPDILLAGNFYENNIQMGRHDADYGTFLINRGRGNFICQGTAGYIIKGQVRHIKKIRLSQNREGILIARNNDSLTLLMLNRQGSVH